MAALDMAIREQHWEVAAYCLLLGLLRTALGVPEDAIPALLEALEGTEDDGEG